TWPPAQRASARRTGWAWALASRVANRRCRWVTSARSATAPPSPWAAPSAAMTARSASVPDLVGRAERGGPLFGHALRRRYVDWRRGIEERDMKHHIRSRRRTALCLGVAATLNSFAATAALATTLQERVSQ